jgi:hypothetical protein
LSNLFQVLYNKESGKWLNTKRTYSMENSGKAFCVSHEIIIL